MMTALTNSLPHSLAILMTTRSTKASLWVFYESLNGLFGLDGHWEGNQ